MIYKRRRLKVVASPHHITPESWWRLEIATRAKATFVVVSGGYGYPREFRVTAHLPLILRARSLAAAECRIPEVLRGLPSEQVIPVVSLYAPSILPEYETLMHIELEDPGEIWLVEAGLVENGSWTYGHQT